MEWNRDLSAAKDGDRVLMECGWGVATGEVDNGRFIDRDGYEMTPLAWAKIDRDPSIIAEYEAEGQREADKSELCAAKYRLADVVAFSLYEEKSAPIVSGPETSNEAYKRGYALIDWSVPIPKAEPKQRRGGARGDFPCPAVVSDDIGQAVYSGADGKQYTSKSALRATYRPEGNPQGYHYEEVGNEPIKPREVTTDKAGIRESIRKAMANAKV